MRSLPTPVTPTSTEEDRLTVSPNPADQLLTVRPFITTNPEKIQLRLLDMNGRLIKQWVNGYGVERNSMDLAVNDVASGVYILAVDYGNGKILRHKIVVQH